MAPERAPGHCIACNSPGAWTLMHATGETFACGAHLDMVARDVLRRDAGPPTPLLLSR